MSLNKNLFYPTSSGQRQDISDTANMAQMPGIGGVDERSHSSSAGAIPSLMDFLWQEYANHIDRKLRDKRRAGQQVKSLDQALQDAPASHFMEFCDRYLSRNRPVQQFPADSNMGFMLSNNKRALLCPAIPQGYAGYGGQMQDAGDVGITKGQSQPGLHGVVNDGSIPII